MAFAPDQFRDVLTYEGRIFGRLRYEAGERDAPPPPAALPIVIQTMLEDQSETGGFEEGDSACRN